MDADSDRGTESEADGGQGAQTKAEQIETKAGLPRKSDDGEPEGFQEEQADDDGDSPHVPLPG